MWTDTSGERRVDEQPVTIPDRIRFLAEALTRLDAMGFGSAIDKAKHLEVLLRQSDLQVLPAIPTPKER